jgi:hypothetical protein
MIKPGDINPDYDIELSDGTNTVGLWLDTFDISPLSEDRFSVFLRSVGKQIGDFDEQRDFTGGLGSERQSDNPTAYFDAQNVWTLSSGHAISGLQWKFARGLRDEDVNLPGSVSWKSLVGSDRYIDVSFSSSGFDAEHILMWVRRRGTPGTLTVELCSDSAGDPGTVLKTATIGASDIDDIISVLNDFSITSQTLTGSTTYHIKIYGASTDNSSSHWEVGCDAGTAGLQSSSGSSWTATTYSPYYRITDADTDRRFYQFHFDGAVYIVDRKDDQATASQLYINGLRGKATSATSTTIVDTGQSMTADRYIDAYIKIIRGTGKGQVRKITDNDATGWTVATWDKTPSTDSEYIIYSTDWFTEIASTGLGIVTGKPASTSGILYFPQGTTAIRRMHLDYTDADDHAFADDGTNIANLLYTYNDISDGIQVWAAKNGDTTSVSRATAAAWGTDLDFGDDIDVGKSTSLITSITSHENGIRVIKEDSFWFINNDRPSLADFGLENAPDNTNGIAVQSHNSLFYFNWMFSDEQIFAGQVTDIGLGWRDAALPDGREGYTSDYVSAMAWLIKSIDAGPSGLSSVQIFDGLAWHELFRAYKIGKRIRSLIWQPNQETRSRLWIGIGGDLAYVEFPYAKPNPLYDSGSRYQHESVFYSGTIDMGTGARLPKYIKALTLLSKNLSASGMEVFVDFQTDEKINSSTWYESGSFTVSPEEELPLNIGDVRQFRYRLRMNTSDASIPVDLQGIVPNGFGRVPFRNIINMRAKAGRIYTPTGKKAITPDELLTWLRDAARFPGRITSRSRYALLNDLRVVISPPSISNVSPEFLDQNWKGSISISMMEI